MRWALVSCLVFVFFIRTGSAGELSTYPAPNGAPISPHFRVEVVQDGVSRPSPVYVSKAQWKTNVHPDTSWTSFSFAGTVTIHVTALNAKPSRVRVLPTSAAVTPTLRGNTAVFSLDRPRQFSVEFDDLTEHPMLVFADPPEKDGDCPNTTETIRFGPGFHDLPDDFRVRSGQTIYIAGGAWVRGRLRGQDASGVRILGRGVLDGTQLAGYTPESGNVERPEHFVRLRGRSDNVTVEGITLVGSPHENLILLGDHCTVRNVKMISWWFSTDGVMLGTHGLIEDCFFKVNDDAVKLYLSDQVVRHCTFWQMENGAAFQISWNMPGRNQRFRVSDCDIIRSEHRWSNDNCALFCAIHGGSGLMSDYVFEDIRIENARWRLISLLIKPNEFSPGVKVPGTISDITFRRITADAPFRLPNRIGGWSAGSRIDNVTFDDVRVGGQRWTNASDAKLELDPVTTSNIRFK